MRDVIVAMIVFGSTPFAFVRPYIGIVIWYWLSLMNPHRLTWGFAYHARFALVVGAATFLAWLVSREPKRPPASAPTILLALFTVWVTVSTIFAENPVEATAKWTQIIKILGMTFIAMCLVQDRFRLQIVVWTVAASVGFYGVRGGAFTILTAGNYLVWGPPDSFLTDNNQLALALIMVLPLIWYLYLTTAQRYLRLGLLGAGALTTLSIFGSHSRGGFLALCVMLTFLWLKSRHKLLTGAAALVLMTGALAFVPSKWFERMETIGTYHEDASVQGRFDAWTFAWRLAKERPLVGGGGNVFGDVQLYSRLVPTAPKTQNAHSIYFEVLGESGFVGLALFLMLGLSCLLTAGGIIRRTRNRPELEWARNLAAMIQVSLLGYASGGAFLNLGFFDLYYTVIAILVALKAVVDRELAREPTVPAAALPRAHAVGSRTAVAAPQPP